MTELLERWRAALPQAPPGAADRAGSDLLRRWAEPHRRYHDVAHLAAVLSAVDELTGHAADADAVRLAAWFHDAVYEAGAVGDVPGSNEEASAQLAEHALPALGVSPDRVATVARLVRLTATHDPVPGDVDGAVLCDADLAVLGGDPPAYADYARRVRAEYGHLSDADFRAGRAAVLRRLLALDPLYRTETARARWERSARANLAAELAES
jgi:predicted metal-dependent HD superfamily phosphohydrolase